MNLFESFLKLMASPFIFNEPFPSPKYLIGQKVITNYGVGTISNLGLAISTYEYTIDLLMPIGSIAQCTELEDNIVPYIHQNSCQNSCH